MSSAPVEPLPVTATQDRTFAALTDGKVDGPGGAGHERDDRGLVALADDPQCSMTALEAEVFDIGGAGFADPETVLAEQHSKRGVATVELFGGDQEHAELGAIQTAGIGGTWGRRTYCAGFDRTRPSMCANR